MTRPRGEGPTMESSGPSVPVPILGLVRQVAGIVRRAAGASGPRVVLFGSWATGEAGERSDVDVGLLGPGPLDPVTLAAIREACEALPTLRTIDLVDLALAPEALRREALARGIEVEAMP